MREGLVDPTVVMFLTQLAQIAVYVVALIAFFHVSKFDKSTHQAWRF